MCMPSWESMLPEWAFKDRRLRTRALILVEALTNAPGRSFANVFEKKKKDVKAAYEFCDNRSVSFPSLLAPAFIATGKVVREQIDNVVLCIQDTTEVDLSSQHEMNGIGEIGNPKCRGIFVHCGLAVTTDGIPVGPLSALTWVRPPEEHGKAASRKERVFDAKESAKWWKNIETAERAVNCPGRLVHVADRESDIFALLARCLISGSRALFRAAQDRKLLDGEHSRLWAEAESWPVKGKRLVDIPARPARAGKPARAARIALLALRFGSVKIAQPDSDKGFLELSAVLVLEEDPPDAEDVIEWLLLTTDVLQTAEDAWTRVDWYRRRWLIEEFHKCLKTTCRIEERQFKERTRFDNYLALVILVSLRLLFMRNVARAEPDAPARQVITDEEEQVLRAYHDEGARTLLPAAMTARNAIRLVAMLGGFLARKGDGEPGIQTLSKGFSKLRTLVCGCRLARRLPLLPDLARLSLDPAVVSYFRRLAAAHISPP